ncbi:MAG: orotidine-5'-phosphate decarboxylase [Planctomycetales bacterium]|nr:orotidine-5'-phosphate decarboxylase [Planctomycetales bacterium]
MSDLHFITRLHDAVNRKRNPVVVGLDPRFEQLPKDIVRSAREAGSGNLAATVAAAFEAFCLRIIDVVAPLVPAVKPQAAFFEEWGPAGCAALARVMRHARQAGLIVICDAKRGDIGSTAEAYARGYLAGADPDAAPWAADALTINPYLGRDTLEPFVRVAIERGAGLYVLVRTSNPGAGTFQDVVSDGQPLYRRVACVVEELATASRGVDMFGAVGAVVGATYPREIAELREAMPHTTFLIPGYGTQGAAAADVAAAFTPDGLGAVVNSSRGIIFAYEKKPYSEQFGEHRWEDAVAAATRDMIADLASHTPTGRLEKP